MARAANEEGEGPEGEVPAPKKQRRESKALVARRARQRRRQLLTGGLIAAGLAAILMAAVTGWPGGINKSTHQHPHIQIFIQGQPVTVPSEIGIDPALYHDHSFDQYGGMDGMSPIHTHTADGVIHLEMSVWHPFTLANFFSVWGQPFGPGQVMSYTGPVTMTVDGAPNEEYGNLLLQDGQQIVIRGS